MAEYDDLLKKYNIEKPDFDFLLNSDLDTNKNIGQKIVSDSYDSGYHQQDATKDISGELESGRDDFIETDVDTEITLSNNGGSIATKVDGGFGQKGLVENEKPRPIRGVSFRDRVANALVNNPRFMNGIIRITIVASILIIIYIFRGSILRYASALIVKVFTLAFAFAFLLIMFAMLLGVIRAENPNAIIRRLFTRMFSNIRRRFRGWGRGRRF